MKEHDRKAKRAAKKNPALRKKLHKDPGIPNMNPFKQQILKKVRAYRAAPSSGRRGVSARVRV